MRWSVRHFSGSALLAAALVGAHPVGAQTAGLSESPLLQKPAMAEAAAVGDTPSQQPEPSATTNSGHLLTKGLASWYGAKFHGRRTASGERYDKNALTAAHKTLPFGTLVRVKNVRSGKEVVVRINDRGPYKRKRVIDLSGAAAAALGITGRGVAMVMLLRE